MKVSRRIVAVLMIAGAFAAATEVQAAIIAIDRDGGAPGPTQSGFVSFPGSNVGNFHTVTSGGITVSDNTLGGNHRDRGAGKGGGGSLDDLIRDFSFSTTSFTVDIGGLAPSTSYLVTLWGTDTSSSGTGSRFYSGTSAAGTLLASQVAPTLSAIAGDQSLAIAFSTVLTSSAGGNIPLFLDADSTVPGSGAGFVAFNGLQVEAVIPEPASMALVGISSLCLLARRRRR